jgi:hypothetical protein
MSGAPSWSRSRPGSPRLEESRRELAHLTRAFKAASSRDAGPAGSLNSMPKRRSSQSPGHWHGTHRILTMSCHVRDIAASTPAMSAAATQSSWFLDAPDCHERKVRQQIRCRFRTARNAPLPPRSSRWRAPDLAQSRLVGISSPCRQSYDRDVSSVLWSLRLAWRQAWRTHL